MKNQFYRELWLLVLWLFCHPIVCYGFLNCTDSLDPNNYVRETTWTLQCFSESSCPDNCSVSYYIANSNEESDACKDYMFAGLSSVGDGLSGFGVLPYVTDEACNYNISFKNMKWNKLLFHSSVKDSKIAEGKNIADACLSLTIPAGFSSNAALFFAHKHWASWASAGYDAELRLMTVDGQQRNYSHFLYKVPDAIGKDGSDIENWVPLVAVEVSHLPWVGVVWPQLPSRFNVSKYRVELQGQDALSVDVHCDGLFCRTKVYVGYMTQTAKVRVSPVHENCSDAACVWETPTLVLHFRLPWYILLLLVATPLLVIVCLVIGIYCMCCTAPAEPVKVLFLFDAVEKEHTRAARILQEYLREVGNVECLYEVDEVPKSASKNASKWLEESLQETVFVLVFASPESVSPIRFTHYPNVFTEALPMLEKRKSCPQHKASGGRVFVAIPPYLNRNDLPDNLRGWPFFYVPSQLNVLLWSLYNPRLASTPISLLARGWLKLIGCPGPTRAYKFRGMRLREALNSAGAEQTLQNQPPPTPTLITRWTTLKMQGDKESIATKELAESRPYPGRLHEIDLTEGRQLLTVSDTASSYGIEEPPSNGVSLQRLL